MYIKELAENTPEESNEKKAEEFLSLGRQKEITSAIELIIEDEFYRLEEYASDYIGEIARKRAERFLQLVLKGNQSAAEALFECGDSGRYRQTGWDAGQPWASLIHGSLFQTSQMELREKLVVEHSELLRNERIKDLESIVEGLTKQVEKLNADLQNAYERM